MDWATVDWTEIARILVQSARVYQPQMQEVQTMLGQDQVDCPRLAQLLDNLANAPQYDELNQLLWDRRDRPGIEGQLYSFRDAYADGVNQFRLDRFRVIRNGCVSGTQPTAEQRQRALDWMDLTGPTGKMEHVINSLGPVIGP